MTDRAGLTAAQWSALALLTRHEERLCRPLEAGDAGVYTETWADSYTVGIHWRTAEALERRGLVTIGEGLVGEPADLYLTDAGRDLIGAAT